jgi:hypothetical protein
LTREAAISLVNMYDGKCSEKYISTFCEFIGITTEKFWQVIDAHGVNKSLFHKINVGKYEPKFKVGHGL